MSKFNAHAKIEAALLAVFLLGSCSSSPYKVDYEFDDNERDEIADLAADVAYDVVSEHETLLILEERIANLEQQLSY